MPFIKKSLSLLAKIKSKILLSTILLGARSLKNLILLVQKSSIVKIVHESRVIENDISKCQKTTNHYTEVTKEIFNKMENDPAANFDSNYHYKGIYKHFAEEALSGKNAPNKIIQKESTALLKKLKYGENPTMLDYSTNNG